jgi:predicted DsbA family dithiol-disulfide isomerase
VNVAWEPFFLNPPGYLPAGGEDFGDHIARKYGPDKAKLFLKPGNPLDLAGEKLGISFNNSRKIYETMDAHRVVEWCKKVAPEKHDTLMEVMFRRYFQDGVDLTKHDVLVGIVKEVDGLNAEECAIMLRGSEMKTEVQSGTRKAKQMNVSGVPFFIIEPLPGAKQSKPVTFSGAQPPELIEEVLQEATSARS